MSGTHWAVAEAWSLQIINFELPTFIQLNKHTWLRSSGGRKGYRDEVSAPEELYNLGWEADTPQLAPRLHQRPKLLLSCDSHQPGMLPQGLLIPIPVAGKREGAPFPLKEISRKFPTLLCL